MLVILLVYFCRFDICSLAFGWPVVLDCLLLFLRFAWLF